MSKFRSDCWPPVPQSLEDIVELQDPWGKTIHGGTLFLGTKVLPRVVDQDISWLYLDMHLDCERIRVVYLFINRMNCPLIWVFFFSPSRCGFRFSQIRFAFSTSYYGIENGGKHNFWGACKISISSIYQFTKCIQ